MMDPHFSRAYPPLSTVVWGGTDGLAFAGYHEADADLLIDPGRQHRDGLVRVEAPTRLALQRLLDFEADAGQVGGGRPEPRRRHLGVDVPSPLNRPVPRGVARRRGAG